MCMQCMAGAMSAGAAASGTRAFVAARHFSWMTPRRLRALTVALLAAALLASAGVVTGSTTKPEHPAAQPAAHASDR
jgi:hypothetical protein